MLAELLGRPFARISISDHSIDPIRLEQIAELLDGLLGVKWRLHLAHHVEHARLSFEMTDRKREAVARTAARIDEGRIGAARVVWTLAHPRIDTILDHLMREDDSMSVRNSPPNSAAA